MNRVELSKKIAEKGSYLCVGLDPDLDLIPKHLLSFSDPIFRFNKAIIDATHYYAVAYKPNLAFYEAYGSEGIKQFENTVAYIKQKDSSLFVIADAKRGDIGNTAEMYAKALLERVKVDAVTLSPYMGFDSVKPFVSRKDKWAVVLALTSNTSAEDFQLMKSFDGKEIYQKVIETAKNWGNEDQIMFVVGATKSDKLIEVRRLIPNHFLLIPGIGAQGGSLEDVSKYGLNSYGGILVNMSRSILYAGKDDEFEIAAKNESERVAEQMKVYLSKYQLR